MSEESKRRIVIVAGIIIVAAILLMLFNRDSDAVAARQSGTVPNGSDAVFGDILIDRQPFTIPDLSVIRASESLNAIGACCADCRPNSGAPVSYRSAPGTTIVFNEGDKGPNVYNYFAPSPPDYSRTSFGLFQAKAR